MLDGKYFRVGLRRGLHGVAAIDEQRRALGEQDGRAGRPGETGQPGESFLAGGQIFVLLAVGARHHQAVEAAALELGVQALDSPRALRAGVRIVECLEPGLEHAAHSRATFGGATFSMPAGGCTKNSHRLASNAATNRLSDSNLCSALYSTQ